MPSEDLDLILRLKDLTKGGASSAGKNLKGVEDQSTKAQKAVRNIGSAAKFSLSEVNKLGKAGIAAGLGVAAIAFQKVDEIDRLAKSIGVSTDELQDMQFVARATNVDVEDMTDSVREMQLRLAEADKLGSGPAVDGLKLLGLTLADIEGLDSPATFDLIRNKLSLLTDAREKQFVQEELLGSSTERLNGLLNLTAQAYDNVRRKAEANNKITEETIKRTQAARVQISELTNKAIIVAANVIGDLIDGWNTLTDLWGNASAPAAIAGDALGLTGNEIQSIIDTMGDPTGDGLLGKLGTWFSTSEDWQTVEYNNQQAILDTNAALIAQVAAVRASEQAFIDKRNTTVAYITSQENVHDAVESARLATLGMTDQLDFYRMALAIAKTPTDDLSGSAFQLASDLFLANNVAATGQAEIIAYGAAVKIAGIFANGTPNFEQAIANIQGAAVTAITNLYSGQFGIGGQGTILNIAQSILDQVDPGSPFGPNLSRPIVSSTSTSTTTTSTTTTSPVSKETTDTEEDKTNPNADAIARNLILGIAKREDMDDLWTKNLLGAWARDVDRAKDDTGLATSEYEAATGYRNEVTRTVFVWRTLKAALAVVGGRDAPGARTTRTSSFYQTANGNIVQHDAEGRSFLISAETGETTLTHTPQGVSQSQTPVNVQVFIGDEQIADPVTRIVNNETERGNIG